MANDNDLPRRLIALIVYGGVAVFVGPLLQLLVFGDHWRLFAALGVFFFASGFFCLAHAIAHAAGYRQVAVILTLIVTGMFFWRPSADAILGPRDVTGELILDSTEDIYVMRASYAVDHNVIYRVVILSEDGDAYAARMTPTQFETWNAMQAACTRPTFTILKHMRKILDMTCPAT